MLVGLAGVEPLLVAPGGPLADLDPHLLLDPRHRYLWHAYARVRAAGDDVRTVDVLGAALLKVGCPTPAEVVTYVMALWAEYPSSLGVNVTRARALLVERDTLTRELEATAARARACGLLLSDTRPHPVSELSVIENEASNSDNVSPLTFGAPQALPRAPRARGVDPVPSPAKVSATDTARDPHTRLATPPVGGSAAARARTSEPDGLTDTARDPHTRLATPPVGGSAAARARTSEPDDLTWCPHPVNKSFVDRHRGVLDTVDVPCLKRGCPWCGPRWVSLHLASVDDALTDRPTWVLTVPRTGWDTFRKRMERTASTWDYKRIPLPDDDAVLVVSTVEAPGAERVSAERLRAVMETALENIRTVKGAKVSASAEWSVAGYRRRTASDDERTTEFFGDVTITLERFQRGLSWWPTVSAEHQFVNGRERVRATGLTPEVYAAVMRNGWVRHPAAVAVDRALRAARRREAERERMETAGLEARVNETRRARACA